MGDLGQVVGGSPQAPGSDGLGTYGEQAGGCEGCARVGDGRSSLQAAPQRAHSWQGFWTCGDIESNEMNTLQL